jgi:hypothetical protein
MKRSVGILSILLILSIGQIVAQQKPTHEQQLMRMPDGNIVCFASEENHPVFIAPRISSQLNSRTQTADIKVDYIGFPADGQLAFQRAVDIWAGLIQSPVRINIRAEWKALAANTLGSAIWGNAFANFNGAPKLNVFYPVALAEKLAGKKLNSDPDPTTGNNYDIYASFNSNQTKWNFTDSPVSNTYNFTTVVLHEIGHGLGFTDSFDVAAEVGSYGLQGTTTPMIFDVGVENSTNSRLLDLPNNSIALGTSLTNSNVSYNPVRSVVGTIANKPKLYAPSPWSVGSSIAHLDQSTYTGTNDRLMRPQLDLAQVTLDPGPIVLNMFADMGWVAPVITHTALKDTEDISNDFTIQVTAAADGTSGYGINNQVKLVYKINGDANVEITQSPTAGNQYSFKIPKPTQTTTATSYNYYLVVNDNYNGQARTFSKPGQIIRPGQTDLQSTFQFTAGPDTTPPTIIHTPLDFILISTTSINLKADVSDNIGVAGVAISYQINSGSFQSLSMTQDNDTLSLYKATIPVSGLADGNTINYQLKATDNSSGQNVGTAPTATTFYSIAVVGNPPAQNSYTNDFNTSSNDFFGNGYSITTPSGFTNGAIHTIHPYQEAGNSKEINYIYQLRFPIRLKSTGASIKFDEIVLVEPGETNTVFGDANFFDYVVAEGSKDGGKTWTPFADGYDSRDYAPWLTKYNSNIISNISQGVGDPSLYKNRTIDMLSKFKAGDEVSVRFRLFSDPGAAGWGWAIDNLKIQIDEAPPVILHNHLDYVLSSTNSLLFSANVTDDSSIDKVFLDYKVNNGTVTSIPMSLSSTANKYELTLDLTSLGITATNKLNYRIRSQDVLGNSSLLPVAGYLDVARITIGSSVVSYVADFNSTNTDFVGNFFSIATPGGFTNGAIHSTHSYPTGFGIPNSSSVFTYMLTKPISISANNPYLYMDEIGIVEPLNDFLNIEGSKDNGFTWLPFLDDYNLAQTSWTIAYNSKSDGAPALYKSRIVTLTQNGNFKSGDQVLIRFRLRSNATVNAWGWAIDNLSIQGPVTGVENLDPETSLQVYPNPSKGSTMTVVLNTEEASSVQLDVLNAYGQLIQHQKVLPISKKVHQEYSINEWPSGLYIIKANVNGNIVTKKFLKTN